MRIINDGLPEPVFEWILAACGEYSKGDADISVTELIGPPRPRILKKKHSHEIEIQASTLINISIGHAVHKGIQDATKTGVAERRLSMMVNGWKLSGGMDSYIDGVINDWKTCNKWKTVMSEKGVIEDFEKQLNIYAQILRENKIPVTNLKIFAIFKDWNRQEFKNYLVKNKIFIPGERSGYPEKEWLYFDLRLWPAKEAKDYIKERISIHQLADKEMPLCTSEDVWGGRRCQSYCEVAAHCSQWKEVQKTGVLK